MNFNKTAELEQHHTRKIIELMSSLTDENQCEEATASLIASLANCLVVTAYSGLREKEMVLDAISAAVNRAFEHREEIIKALNVSFQIIKK